MRLKSIKPVNFRCYGESNPIDISSDLVLIYGPNGYGKTSLVEAIEWLLHGRAKRREKGREISKRDYQTYYRNVHASDDHPTYVEAVIDIAGTEYRLKRELDLDDDQEDSTRTFVDGDLTSFTTLGITDDRLYDPVVPQHSLQDFINSTPHERRNLISSALGLDALVRLSKATQQARNKLRSDPPSLVKAARGTCQKVIDAMSESSLEALRQLGQKWENDDIDKTHESEIIELAQSHLSTTDNQWSELKRKAREQKRQSEQNVFDIDKILIERSPEEVFSSELPSLDDQVETLINKAKAAIGEYYTTAEKTYSEALVKLWKSGLKLQEDNSEECPLCESDALNAQKREELQSRIESSKSLDSDKAEVQRVCSRIQDLIDSILNYSDLLSPNFMNEEEINRFKDKFPSTGARSYFLSTHKTVCLSIYLNDLVLRALKADLGNVAEILSEPEKLAEVKSVLDQCLVSIPRSGEAIKMSLLDYKQVADSYKGKLLEVIGSKQKVKDSTAVFDVLDGWHDILVYREYLEVLNSESLGVEQKTKSHLEQKQNELLNTRGKAIGSWYKKMNPGSDVTFSHMETTKTTVTLYADAHGKKINAAASLSQCQSNCLGLSIHFMRALTSSSPFNFIILDDPVQSMDDDHRSALVMDVLDDIMTSKNYQVIVASHLKGVSDDIMHTYRSSDITYYKITNITSKGPEISYSETVRDCLTQVEKLMKGNEDNRRGAMKVLRRAVELFVRRVGSENGARVPHNASFGGLAPIFRSVQCTTQKHADGLDKTVDFVNPATHTQRGWSVPKETHIQPHLNRVRQYAKMYGVLDAQ